MNQARHQDGPYDDGWYDDEGRAPSLGVWPLGRTYVHSSDGALNTGPASDLGRRAAPERDGRLQPPPSGRPPLYQVGGRYRGDEWPTDPGFRRGDLGLDDDEPGTGYAPPDDRRRQEPWHASDRRVPPAEAGRTDAYRLDPGTWDSGAWDARDVYGEVHGEVHGETYGDRQSPRPRQHDSSQQAARPRQRQRDPRDDREYPEYGEYGQYRERPEPPRERPSRRPEREEPPRRIRPAVEGETPPKRDGTERGWTRGITPAARVAAVEDAKLLAALQAIIERVKRIPSLYPRLVFLVVGYAAITSLAAAYAEKVPLPITASLIVIPAAGVIFSMGMRYPAWGRRALVGWISGIVATIIYDCLRLALVKVGIWGDPIPGIGRLVLSDPHANFAWGYLWRFLGNGGGMGIAYTMLPWRGWRTGVAYGTLICTGLVGLLYFFPVAQVHFFPLTPVTAIGGYAGHWVYGAVLGALTSWWLPPVELGRIHGRLTARLRHPGHRPRPSHARSGSAAEERFRRTMDRRSA
jgi:hypothetical protein